MKKHWSIVTVVMAIISSFLLSSPALAIFHLWDISEIFSNADGTVQYIELFTANNGQQFTVDATIRATQGVSSNDFVFPGNTPAPTAGHHLLLATVAFASLPGAVTPNFILADGFLFRPDGLVDFMGANRMGYDCLPTDGSLSLHCDANNGVQCTATSIGVNSPTNYAGAIGSIDVSGGGCTDTDGDGFGSPGNAACPGGAEQDCDDCDATVFPGASETICDSIDNDCDPGTEDDPDNDNDGVGVCTDCDDADPDRFPGNPEVFCNGIDEDCDPSTLDDPNADGDPVSFCSGDCDDANPAVFPGNVETTCNGVDDDCDPGTLDDPANECVSPADPPNDRLKNRYISFKPGHVGQLVKLKITLTASLPHPGSVNDSWWVKAPVVPVPELFPKPLVGLGECVALLGPEASAAEIDWDAAGCQTLHVTGCPIEPTSEYEVEAELGGVLSFPLTVLTALQPDAGRFWGDTVGTFDGTEWTAAQGVSNINDAVVAINTFQGGQVVAPIPGSTIAHLSVPDVEPGNINTVVNFADVLILINAFKGDPYPFGPADADGNCP